MGATHVMLTLSHVSSGAVTGYSFRMDIGTHCGKETKRENTQQTCFAASTVTDDDQFPRATVDVRKVGSQKEGLCKKNVYGQAP